MSWFSRDKGHTLDDEDRELSRQTRQMRMQAKLFELEEMKVEHEINMKRLQMALQEEPGGSTSDPWMALAATLAPVLIAKFAPGVPDSMQQPSPTVPPNAPARLSDDELREMWSAVPKVYRAAARTTPEATLQKIIRGRMPGFDDDTYDRAVLLAHNKLVASSVSDSTVVS